MTKYHFRTNSMLHILPTWSLVRMMNKSIKKKAKFLQLEVLCYS